MNAESLEVVALSDSLVYVENEQVLNLNDKILDGKYLIF